MGDCGFADFALTADFGDRLKMDGVCSARLLERANLMSFKLEGLRVKELLQLEAEIVVELRRRDLVRTNNKPLGDIAEQIVLLARGGILEPNSTKSHDISDPQGRRIQVKAMGTRRSGHASKFSPFRSFEFDTAVFLVFDSTNFDLVLSREVASMEIETVASYSQHTNGRQPTLRQIESLGTDVTEEMSSAYIKLDAIRGLARREESSSAID